MSPVSAARRPVATSRATGVTTDLDFGDPRAGSLPDLDDAAVIARSHDDLDAFGILFDRHAVAIHTYLSRRAGTHLADDLTAEAFLVALKRRAVYDPSQANARPWLYGIATNLLHRHHRQEARQYRALSRTGVDPVAENHADAVAARVAAGALTRQLAAGLARLSVGDRDVLLLVAWGGLAYAEVADALSIPVGTVRSRLNRARRKLRTTLGDHIQGDSV
jgi:RNA polymerase sigma-70 factor (ECF subfamily)